jgi:hypothetical protein
MIEREQTMRKMTQKVDLKSNSYKIKMTKIVGKGTDYFYITEGKEKIKTTNKTSIGRQKEPTQKIC